MIRVEQCSKEDSDRIRFVLFAFIAFTLVSAWFTLSDLVAALFPDLFSYESSCIMLNIADIPCPFCGMSRAWRELIGLNFSRSVYYNPLAIPFFALSFLIMIAIFALSLFNYRIRITDAKKTFLAAALVLLVIWIANILYGHQS